MDLVLPTTPVIAERESTVLLNSDPTLIRNSPKRTKLSLDPMVEFFAEDASNPESSELSSLRKSRPSSAPNKSLPRNDDPII